MSLRRPIRPLAAALIDQIAAGEVVERPSSVVKELVENALDSGAQQVAIDLTQGGLGAIVITDDGCGMDPTELHAAIARHHTSKLRAFADLQSLTSFGFRGEALSSIASVSRLTLTSRPRGAAVATRLRAEGGQVLAVEPVGAPCGTSLCVEDLFYNVPARRKFLRGAATEQAHVHESLLRTAIGCRTGGFVLTAGTRTLLDVPHSAAPHDRPQLAFGRRQRRLTPFAGGTGDVAVSGFLAAPSQSRRDASSLWAFVNGRPVRDRMLQRATLAGYQAAFVDAFACMLVFVDVAPDAVDVNVHPQKLEVRFGDAHGVYQAVVQAVALAAGQLAGTVERARTAAGLSGTSASWGSPLALATEPASATAVPEIALRAARLPSAAASAGAAFVPAERRLAGPNAACANAPAQRPLPLRCAFAWQQLRPLSATPPGQLCCAHDDRAIVFISLPRARAAIARRAVRQAATAPGGATTASKLPLAAAWTAFPAASLRLTAGLAAAIARWGLHLEAIGEHRFLICALPRPLALAAPAAVADAFFAASVLALAPSGPTCPARAPVAWDAWCAAVTAAGGWPEQRPEPVGRWAGGLLAELDAAAVRVGEVATLIDGKHACLSTAPAVLLGSTGNPGQSSLDGAGGSPYNARRSGP